MYQIVDVSGRVLYTGDDARDILNEMSIAFDIRVSTYKECRTAWLLLLAPTNGSAIEQAVAMRVLAGL
jgi:hypothetical protein